MLRIIVLKSGTNRHEYVHQPIAPSAHSPMGSALVGCLWTALRALRTPHRSNNFQCHTIRMTFLGMEMSKLAMHGINFKQFRLIILTMIYWFQNRNVNHTSANVCSVHTTILTPNVNSNNSKCFLQIFKLDSSKRKNSCGCSLFCLFIATKYFRSPFVLLCQRNESNVKHYFYSIEFRLRLTLHRISSFHTQASDECLELYA